MAKAGKPILDFQVEKTNDPRVLLIDDTSVWAFIENKPSIIEIIIPGRRVPVVTRFDKLKRNVFHSITLSINCISGCQSLEHIDLPDGIYNIKIKGSPSNLFSKERNYLRDVNLRIRRDILYISLDLYNDNSIVKGIRQVDLFLDAANANIKFNNVAKAQALYQEALDLIEKLENCEDCKQDVWTEYKT